VQSSVKEKLRNLVGGTDGSQYESLRWSDLMYDFFFTEPELIQSRPSLLATASISAAVRGLNSPSAATVLTSVCAMTRVDPAAAEHVVRHIERVVASETASLQPLPTTSNKVASSASSSAKVMSGAEETGQPETPTDVQDVHF
jgi:hypothetical protein